MSVRQNLLTGECFIDGKLVTPENEQELKVKEFNRNAIAVLSTTYSNVQYLWRGIKDFPPRDELLKKIDELIQELQGS